MNYIGMQLTTVCQQLPPFMHLALWLVVLAWEYGLGKTKYGSSIGLFIETPLNKFLAYVAGLFKVN